ncbi:MAG: bifunctional DNA primase/polymerase [Terracidiphilus sp.]|nr:bifunctional DNA primase/polymerase [Terracidiphilus sp.]
MSTLTDALAYAARGWLVVPLHAPKQGVCSCRRKNCGSPGKHPRTEHGLKDGSKDPGQIRNWWKKWPDANVGILTGQESGLVVLDVDGEDGKASLQALTAANGPLPKTPMVKTGRTGNDGKRKGCHYYFREPTGISIRNSAGFLGKGLDVRADGGYVVAPPSLHPSGLLYEWLAPEQPLADLPPWLLAKLAEAKSATVAKTQPTQAEAIAEGGRNAALASLAGSMRRRGMSSEAINAALMKENDARCKPPLPAIEVREIARSVARYEPAAPVTASESAQKPRASQPPRQLPAPLGEAAYYGLAGDFARLVEPETEADPAALLFQFLAAMGSIVGRGPHYRVGAAKHHTNLFMVIVGNSAKARKGTSWGEVHAACKSIDLSWWSRRITSGLSTGEGLIHAVRDEIKESVAIKERGKVTDYQEQVTDPGEADKRLLCVESELGRALQSAARDGNTLSPVIRLAWDGDALRVLTKNARETCAAPHISIIGHITNTELQRLLTESDAANGFANRFLWVCSTRSKCLPFGGNVDNAALESFCECVRNAVEFARKVEAIAWAPDAAERWEAEYPKLSEGKPGLFGQVTARAEAQTIRLALLYAVLDKSAEIRLEHLNAALELWRYCEDSAAFIFGASLGNPLADAMIELLRAHPDGMTRTEISNHFGRNKSKAALDTAIAAAQRNGSLRIEKRETGGRVAEVLQLVRT